MGCLTDKALFSTQTGNVAARKFLMEALTKNTLESYYLLSKINAVLVRLRMDWFPTSGAGSQDGVFETNQAYVNACAAEINRLNQFCGDF